MSETERRSAVPWLRALLTAGILALSCDRSSVRESTSPVLDRGGVSVDLSSGPSGTAVTGDNLVQNGGMEASDATGITAWHPDSYVWLPKADKTREAQMHARLRPCMKWGASTVATHSGEHSAHLATPSDAFDDRDPAGHEFCAYYHQKVALPPLNGSTKFVLSYHYRSCCDTRVPNSRPYVRLTFLDGAGPGEAGETRTYAQNILPDSEEWQRRELCFTAPGNTRRLDVRLALAGSGEVWFDDVALHKTLRQPKGPTVRLMPWAFLDNLYCLSTGDAGVMTFGFRNETSAPINKPHLLLQLPAAAEILDLDRAARIVSQERKEIDGEPVQEYRIDMIAWKGRIRGGNYRYPYNMWQGLTLLLRTSEPSSDTRCKGRYWLEDGDYRTTPLDFEMQIVPSVPGTEGPKRFKSGAHLFLVQNFAKPEAVKAFADLYRRVGFNAVHVPPSPLGAQLGRLGIERYTQPLNNGYTMGDRAPGKKPDDVVFRLVDGSPRWEAICPVEVYTRGPYFRSRIENDTLRRILVTERQAEQIMCNWEPFMYNGKGCFCDRCKAEFAAYSKLPPGEVARVWPKSVIQQHGEAWVKFRSWQHGKLMATIEETVHAVGKEAGLDSHFIPELHYALLTEYRDKMHHGCEFATTDYLDKLPVLEPWAPYNWYIFGRGPYKYVRGRHLSCHASAQDVRAFLAKRLPEGKRPRLIAFPYGTYEGATEPEAIAFEILTYFLNGYSGAFVYLFPGGYDARYWKALTEANRLIAQFEDAVCDGKAIRRHEVTPESPLPKLDPALPSTCGCVGPRFTERWKELSLLQSWEFERGRSRLIAVGNFWERGDCFFRLKLDGLDPGARYVLHEPAHQRCYADRDGSIALRVEDLSRGVLLHVGALRYAFFVLEPYRDGMDLGSVIRPQGMETAKKEAMIRSTEREATESSKARKEQ